MRRLQQQMEQIQKLRSELQEAQRQATEATEKLHLEELHRVRIVESAVQKCESLEESLLSTREEISAQEQQLAQRQWL